MTNTSTTITQASARREAAVLKILRSDSIVALPPMPLLRTDQSRQAYCRWLAKEADRLMQQEVMKR